MLVTCAPSRGLLGRVSRLESLPSYEEADPKSQHLCYLYGVRRMDIHTHSVQRTTWLLRRLESLPSYEETSPKAERLHVTRLHSVCAEDHLAIRHLPSRRGQHLNLRCRRCSPCTAKPNSAGDTCSTALHWRAKHRSCPASWQNLKVWPVVDSFLPPSPPECCAACRFQQYAQGCCGLP